MNSIVMENFMNWFKRNYRKRFFKYGLPFCVFIVGGSFGLREFTQLRYQFATREVLRPEDLKPYGIEMKKPGEVTLETEYEKIKNMDIDNWENIRGPRPWEQPVNTK